MTGAGHTHTGIGLSIAVYYYAYNKMAETVGERSFLTNTNFDMYLLMALSIVAACLCISGSTAPDWLEIRKKGGGTVIKHRTITHWVLIWILLLTFGLTIDRLDFINNSWLGQNVFIRDIIGVLIAGFTIGGLTHLITDLPNKQGIPILFPTQKFCLYAWKSGRNEQFLITISYLVSFFYIGMDTRVIIVDYSRLLTILGLN